MPAWKKVIVSGSDAALNSLIVTSGITGSLQGTASFAITASYVLNGGGTPIYVHTQSIASNTWSINHNLETSFPIITVYDNVNNVILPQEITTTSTSSINITFPIPLTGYASIAGGSFINQESNYLTSVALAIALT
jgi:hypothetical protein